MNTIDWLRQAVPQTANLQTYVPGKPVEQMLRELGLGEAEMSSRLASTVKLASNENPFGPPPKAIAAMQQAASQVHRYPDGDCFALKQALAKHHGVSIGQLLVGNGSNEVLELLIRTFAGAGDEVVYSQRAFMVYALATAASGAKGIAVPEADGLGHDLAAMAKAVNANTKVVCIANPNNPTGSLLSTTALQDFLDGLPRQIVVILDEAYYEYVRHELQDSIHALSHPGLIISRTFSKAYGLAGARVGYAIADAELLAVVGRFREPFNVNMLAQVGAIAALAEQDWVMAQVDLCVAERTRLELVLAERGLLCGKSFGNFVLLQIKNALDLVKAMEKRGVILRPLAGYGMPDVIRVSVGSAAENEKFVQALDAELQA